MILLVLVALGLGYVVGCWMGQAAAAGGWRYLRRRGWRLWYLGRLYEIPQDGVYDARQTAAAHARERAAREKTTPPPKHRLS